MEEFNLEKVKDSLVGIRSHVLEMIKREEETIKKFEELMIAHSNNAVTEEKVLQMEEQHRLQAEKDNKEIDEILEKLKDKLRLLGLSEEEVEKQVGNR